VYVAGVRPITPKWTCTDRGGSSLTGCTVDGLVDGHLAGMAGTHTFSVTAVDGEGNETTVTRQYTVLSAPRPDGQIRKAGGAWRGADVYGSASDQTIRQRVRRGQTRSFQWLVQNDGERPERFRLVGAPGNQRWRVRYFAGGKDVTRAVSAGRYRTGTLSPGERVSLRVKVTPTRQARLSSTRVVTLRAAADHVATSTDKVAVRVQLRR
jgi:hypothetical protein